MTVTTTQEDRRAFASSTTAQVEELNKKATAYYADLQVYSPEHTPAEWATTQNNLGTTLAAKARLVEGPERQNLYTQAILAYRAALQMHTPEDTPLPWATEQSNLGNALRESVQLAQGPQQQSLLIPEE